MPIEVLDRTNIPHVAWKAKVDAYLATIKKNEGKGFKIHRESTWVLRSLRAILRKALGGKSAGWHTSLSRGNLYIWKA